MPSRDADEIGIVREEPQRKVAHEFQHAEPRLVRVPVVILAHQQARVD